MKLNEMFEKQKFNLYMSINFTLIWKFVFVRKLPD